MPQIVLVNDSTPDPPYNMHDRLVFVESPIKCQREEP